MKARLKTTFISEDAFKVLLDSGYFKHIFTHPKLEVYSAEKTIVVYIPGAGAVQVAVTEQGEQAKTEGP